MYGHGDPRKKQWWVFWDFFRLIYLKFGAEGAGNKETATDKDKKKKKEKKKKTPKAYPSYQKKKKGKGKPSKTNKCIRNLLKRNTLLHPKMIETKVSSTLHQQRLSEEFRY